MITSYPRMAIITNADTAKHVINREKGRAGYIFLLYYSDAFPLGSNGKKTATVPETMKSAPEI